MGCGNRPRIDSAGPRPLCRGHFACRFAGRSSRLTACEDGRVRLWDVDAAKQLGEFSMPGETITSVAFSPDGPIAVTTSTVASQLKDSAASGPQAARAAGAVSEIRLWDLKTLKQLPGSGGANSPLHQFRETSALAWQTIYSPNGASLLTVIGNEVRMLGAKSGQESMAFVPQGAVASARFSPDGRRVVTSSWDNTARIWNIVGPRAEVKLVGHAGYVNDAVFSPGDGRFVATAARDNEAILWDAGTGKLLARFNGEGGHHGPVTSVAFDAASQRLVTASQDRTAKIWDVKTRKVLVTLGGSAERQRQSPTPPCRASILIRKPSCGPSSRPTASACSPPAKTIGQSFGMPPPVLRSCNSRATQPPLPPSVSP